MSTTTAPETNECATIVRNETLADAIDRLKALRAKQRDLVVPREQISGSRGQLQVIDSKGERIRIVPSPNMESQMASELGWNLKHFRSARADSAEMNGIELGLIAPDSDAERFARMGECEWRFALANRLRHGRKGHMIRTYHEGGDLYTGRSFHSPSYGAFDHLDCTGYVLEALMASDLGLTPETVNARMDLTEHRMVLKVNVPSIAVLAREWLKDYQNPIPQSHSGYAPGTEPIVEAGVVITNSETGRGSLSMAPYFLIRICRNGAVVAHELAKHTHDHRGKAAGFGDVPMGADTRSSFARWVSLTMRDNLAHWMSEEYVAETIAGWNAKAGREVEVTTGAELIKEVGQSFDLDDKTIDSIAAMWFAGRQYTSGGVGQAFTAAAQLTGDAELAWTLELNAQTATERAYALAR